MKKIIYLSIFILNACESNNSLKIQKGLSRFITNETKICVVIPREGCGGCISDATSFFVKNRIKKSTVCIIFTGVKDKKELRLKVGETFLNSGNVYIDTLNTLMIPSEASIYPQVYYLESKSIVKTSIFEASEFEKSDFTGNK
jgi:hypothetical protein